MSNKEMKQIIQEYQEQNNIDDISEEEITNIFGESFLFPHLYLPRGGKDFYDCIILADYEHNLLLMGFNIIEDYISEYLEEHKKTEDGIDLGDNDTFNQLDWEMEIEDEIDFIKLSMRTETKEVFCTDAFDAIKWYRSEMDDTTLFLKVHCDAGDGKFLIIKANAEHFYFYSVYLDFAYDEHCQKIELGTCTDPDDVYKIIMYFLKTGEAYGHK